MGQGIYSPAASLSLAYIGINNPPVLNTDTQETENLYKAILS
jgi:hypothetical protein